MQQQFLPRLSTMRTTAGLRFYIAIWRIKEKSYYTKPDNEVKLEVRLEEETVWLTQAQMAELFQTWQKDVRLLQIRDTRYEHHRFAVRHLKNFSIIPPALCAQPQEAGGCALWKD